MNRPINIPKSNRYRSFSKKQAQFWSLTHFPALACLAVSIFTPLAAAQSPIATIPDAIADTQRPLEGTVLPQPAGMKELIQQKKWNEASGVAEEAVRKNPTDANAIYWLGVARLQLHDYIGATRALRSAQKDGIQDSLTTH